MSVTGLLHQNSVLLAHPDPFIGSYVADGLRRAGAVVRVCSDGECEVDGLLDGFASGAVIASAQHGRVLDQALLRWGAVQPVLLLIGEPAPRTLRDRDIPVLCYPFASYQIVDALCVLFDHAGSFPQAGAPE